MARASWNQHQGIISSPRQDLRSCVASFSSSANDDSPGHFFRRAPSLECGYCSFGVGPKERLKDRYKGLDGGPFPAIYSLDLGCRTRSDLVVIGRCRFPVRTMGSE